MTNELFACDGRVDEEKMYELLDVGTETEALDYKATLDLSRGAEKNKVEFAKDCMSMMNLPSGGYLVIGADGQGSPATGVEAIERSHFDSASLMQRVRTFVDCPVDLISSVHTHSDGTEIALIYVRPTRSGFPAIASREGSYGDGADRRTVFREGDIFIREGTVNARISHRMWPMALTRYREAVKAESREDIDHLVRRVVEALNGEGSGRQPVALTLDMDDESFVSSVHAALDAGNNAILRRFTSEAKSRIRATYRDATGENRQKALDRLTEYTAVAIASELDAQAEAGIKALFSAYMAPLHDSGIASTSVGSHVVETAGYWLDIMVRIYALGALAVRYDRWNLMRFLILQSVGDDTYSYRSWIRHGMVEASRAGILSPKAGEEARSGVVISLALDLCTKLPALSPDSDLEGTSEDGIERALAESILNSICQFDILYCIVAATATESRDLLGYEFYPASAAFQQRRVDPALERVARDVEMRSALFLDIPATDLAAALQLVMEMARRESWRYGNFWHGLQGAAGRFAEAHSS